MSDFTSGFWNVYISAITVVSILACGILLASNNERQAAGAVELKDHTWDETLQEYDNPLPRWWMWMFYITIVFSIGYLAVYPALGSFRGSFGWSSLGQYQAEVNQAQSQYGPLFAKFLQQDLKAVAADPEATKMGERLFLTYCAQCHGSDARGARGFPNLADGDWLYGGDPQVIKTTIMEGRNGVMPALGPSLGREGTQAVANYVRALSGLSHDAGKAARGKELFAQNCAACHGPDGRGSTVVGAPNLTDKTWLYGSSETTIIETVTKGRNNQMPAHKDFLGEAKVHLLAAYVWGLSAGGHSPAVAAAGNARP